MFLSAVIPLVATETPERQVYLGRASHAWFLRQVAAADEGLAERLHSARSPKPFTVSALRSWHDPREPLPEVEAGERYFLRWTALEAELSQILLEKVLPRLPDQVHLGPVAFQVQAPLTEEADHPWARTTTAEALVETWMGTAAGRERRLWLEFASPATVRRVGRNVVVPLPEVIFKGYRRAWNQYGAARFDQDLLHLIESEVAISRYWLRTELVDAGRYQDRGWAGRCEYRLFSREPAVRGVVHLLADFSLFCGTGYKTTQGMGQTRLRSKRTDK